MRKFMLSLFVLTLALLTFAHLAAADEMKVKATLTGAAEVPGPGDTDGGGTVQVTLNPDKGEVCYELSVANLQEATAAHIHKGEKGEEGQIEVALADVVVIEAIMQDPTDYYVNVHTAAFPKGAVRGKLSR